MVSGKGKSGTTVYKVTWVGSLGVLCSTEVRGDFRLGNFLRNLNVCPMLKNTVKIIVEESHQSCWGIYS
jgi:hypothetical protein